MTRQNRKPSAMELKSTVVQQQKAIEVLSAQLQRTGGANPKSERTARCFKRRTCAENGFESRLGTQGLVATLLCDLSTRTQPAIPLGELGKSRKSGIQDSMLVVPAALGEVCQALTLHSHFFLLTSPSWLLYRLALSRKRARSVRSVLASLPNRKH